MNATEGQSLVIKMAQKNKETQTVKLGGWFGAPFQAASYTSLIPQTTCQFYMDREEELYRRACQMKGIHVQRGDELREDEDPGSDGEPSKVIYRYTLDEMKSYNPYRFINF
ncbi:uncharacterized protein LOC115634767 [Scaptodrosophila lebanonensis]|uniref:Uncharacterized protein LOC115634767 n=1 Tax=Drosophila lebanonensis TaxID=7225 RepID=A0A6J2UK05_DROLE|nr:uncharacterized protein LOC115634767 [Scaptodrosophila lebanonensis]